MKKVTIFCLSILLGASSVMADEQSSISEMQNRAIAWQSFACPKAPHEESCRDSFEEFIAFIDLVKRKKMMRDFLKELAMDPAYRRVAQFAENDYENHFIALTLTSMSLARKYPAISKNDP